MASLRQNGSSSASENDHRHAIGIDDEKKRKRRISNREAARRSGMKKHKHLLDLTEEVCRLRDENNAIAARINELEVKYAAMVKENDVLRAQKMELTERLEYLNGVIMNCNEMDFDGDDE